MDNLEGVAEPTAGVMDADPQISATVDAGVESQPVSATGKVVEPTTNETPEADAHPYEGEASPSNWAKARSSYEKLNGGFTEVAKAILGDEGLEQIAKLPITERVERIAEAYQQQKEELNLLKSDEFVGIKVDKPSSQWEPKEQWEALPDSYKAKLADVVISDQIPKIAERVLGEANPTDPQFQALYKSAELFVQKAYSRPAAEVDAIMEAFAGMSIAEVQSFFQAASQGFNNTGNYAGQGGYQSAPVVAQNQPLLQAAVNAGLDLEDPQQLQFVNGISQMLTASQVAAQREANATKQQMQAMEQKIAELSGKSQQQETQSLTSEIDTQVTTVHSTALETATRGIQALPPAEKASLERQIRALAKEILEPDQQVKDAPGLAKDFLKDGLKGKANYQLALLSARVNKAYLTAASEILKGKVKQTDALRVSDANKQARKEIGVSSAGVSSSPAAAILNDRVGYGADQAAEYAARMWREQNAS